MKLLDGIEGIICLIDDVLVHGRMQEEHDERLHKVLRRLGEPRMTLNKEKCMFCAKFSQKMVFHQTQRRLLQFYR